MKELTTLEAAAKLGVTKRRVIALTETGGLPAEMFGKTYMIKESDLKLVEERKPGRPPKPERITKSGQDNFSIILDCEAMSLVIAMGKSVETLPPEPKLESRLPSALYLASTKSIPAPLFPTPAVSILLSD